MKSFTKELKFNTKGLTLIALVITIIVLIILASVSISMISGQDGILTKAGNASVQSDIATTNEQIDLELIGKYDNNGEYTNADVITAVKNATGNDVTEGDDTVITKKGNEINISDLWVTKQLSKITIGEKIGVKSEYTEKDTGYKITIPVGYTIHKDSSTKISEGIVIEDENNNEFVWVPVPNAIANSESEMETMIQNKKSPLAVKTSSTDSNGNTEYKGVIYDFTSSGITTKNYSTTSGWREPAYLTDPDYGDASTNGKSYLRNIVGMTQIDDTELKIAWSNQMQNEFDDMVEKVSSAGGYYISRYEMSGTINQNTGDINTESKPNATAFTAGTSYKGDYLRWYGLYKAGKSYTHSGIKSTMIWGSQYDQMLIWMDKTGTNVTQSSSIKNTSYVGSLQKIINNVYDLSGEYHEWTIEAFDSYSRTMRRGYADIHASVSSRYHYSPITNGSDLSSRLVIYVK